MKKIVTATRSILISRGLVYFFTLLLITLDVTGWWLGMRLEGTALLRHTISFEDSLCFIICLYSCSIPAYYVLYALHRLLINVAAGKVFISENVSLLRRSSWCLLAAAAICLIGVIWLRVLLIIVAAACFVGLIVRIVMNVFEQAIAMKEELDLTV
ncbi:MAG: DUF2975 domain-containing protein [Proteobacteria bacterium]|nr:DUF2975 domain-containing protein [Pseudomonadota bacterium]